MVYSIYLYVIGTNLDDEYRILVDIMAVLGNSAMESIFAS